MDSTLSVFLDGALIASGERDEVTRTVEDFYLDDHSAVRAFDDATGRVTDLDYWDAGRSAPPPRGRGRPRLGVTAREVTLLPRHWEWLSTQAGGASAALRRLVEEARRGAEAGGRTERQRRDAAYHFMQATCGDRPGYEEALRSLYKGDESRFAALTANWPDDVRSYIAKLMT